MEDKNNNIIKDNLEVLYAISEIAAQTKDLPSLWGPLLDKSLEALKVDAGTLMILEGDTLSRKASRGLGDEIMQEPPIPSAKGGISWRVVSNRQPAIVTDLKKEKIASKTLEEAGFHSLVTVPMMVRDQVIGVMSIFTRKERRFSEKDLNFFKVIANQAALAIISIRSAEILGENRRRLAELEALNQISKSISTLFDYEETLYSIVVSITKMLRGDKGVLVLFDHKDHLLKAANPAYGISPDQVNDFRLRTDEAVTGQSFCKGIPIMMNKIDAQTDEVLKRAKISNVKSILTAPLKVKSQTMGVIQVFSSSQNNFHFDDLHLFTILSSQAAIVVNSTLLYREIEEERKKDEALLASIGDGVVAIDKDQKIIHLNRAGESITGYLSEELLGKTFFETLGLWDKEGKLLEAKDYQISQLLSGGKPKVTKDFYLKKRNGQLFPAYLSLAAVYDANDNIIGAIVIFRDISYELELERMKQELISISTHELRSPITAIKGYLDMVLSGDAGAINAEAKENLEEVVKINQRLADLVDDLLNVGRIEQGRMTIRLQKIDLLGLIDQTIQEYTPLAKDKNLRLSFQKVDLPQIKADPTRLRQVLNNLISNAIKYTHSGSVEVIAKQEEKNVVCQIKDSGLGIDKASQSRLFEKFYRVKTEQTRQITGTGLGLWISKKIVEMMGGKIWFESTEGKGSSFYFRLPIA